MFALSKFEWLALAVALFLCPGSPWGAEPQAGAGASDRDRDGRISRAEFNLVGTTPSQPQPSAAAGGSRAPKQE